MLLLFNDTDTIYSSFLRFHKQNPRVYELFTAFALQLINGGHEKIGAKMIVERIRWEIATGSKDDKGFKINNNYTAHYVRLFQQQHKQYADRFETRTIKTM